MFRRVIRLDDDPRSIAERLGDAERRDEKGNWQKADFEALDPAWERVVGGPDDATRVRRAWIERPRGHSKTSDTAAMVAWVLVAADAPISGLVAAATQEQASLLRRAIGRLVEANPRLSSLRVLADRVACDRSGSQVRVISSDAAGSYGELADFVVCDELCHWAGPELWHSLVSTAAKRPRCLLVVLTNAGVGRGWQWQAREAARRSHESGGRWHFSSLDGVQAQWLRAGDLDEQRRLLPPPVYARLWENRWQHSDGGFVTLAEAEACRDESLTEQTRGRPGVGYVAAVDYGEKHDRTAAVVCHREAGGRVVVDRLDVAAPEPGRPVPVAWVEDWIARQAAAFPGLRVTVDEHQLVGVVQRLEGRLPVERFAFAGGGGNHRLALCLRRLIAERAVAWPAGCGAVEDLPGVRDDLETELSALVLRQSAGGRVRFDHPAGGHDDRAFVLAAACLSLLERGEGDWMSVGRM